MRSMRKSLLMAAMSCCLPTYMSDADAGAPSSTEPVTAENAPREAGTAAAREPSSSLSSGDSGTGEAGNADAGTPPAGAATPASTGNVLLNAAPVVDAPAIDAPAAAAPVPEVAEPLPRESHLMLLEHKFAAALAKLRNAERVAVDELEAIWVHVKAVL